MREAATHRVPRRSASWAYVFGSASLTLLILQFVTGICLAFVYVPSADEAWNSLQHSTKCRASAGSSARCTAGVRTSWSRMVLIHMVPGVPVRRVTNIRAS